MYLKEGSKVKVTYFDGSIFVGIAGPTEIRICTDDNNHPHALFYIFNDPYEEHVCVWVDKIKEIQIIE